MVDLEVRGVINVVEACAQTESVEKMVFSSSLAAGIWRENVCMEKDVDERSWSDAEFCRKVKNTEMDEECQIQLALELSAKEDPEAFQIEAVKQISLGSCPPQNTPAEVVAYRYWVYHGVTFDGSTVAVKVQRPNLLHAVVRDIYIL